MSQTPPEFTNRLAREKSPYLLQHAHNPVDWFPWGEEAFAKAKSEDKPILLSIGYATCHWCHVMERESFEDRDTARLLNELFVPIKVDREERPDVDQIYMKALHATGQQGGWPLNMFLTPDLLPVTGGTYFPPQPAHGRPSFGQVLENISKLWNENRTKLTESADTLHAFLKQSDGPAADSPLPDQAALDASFGLYENIYDRFRGGFAGNGPNKFPPSMGLVFLLEYYRRSEKPAALAMVEETLDAMRRGGIYDQVGGGLSRYATDHDWLVPHFEKMLYDNALFLRALVDAYRLTGNARYKAWAHDLCNYIRRDMTSPEGAFYSAEDADSEGEEGKFYVWTATEIEQVLSDAGIAIEDRKLLVEFWGIRTRGNFEGKTILNEPTMRERFLAGLNGLAGTPQKSAVEWDTILDQARAALLKARDKRVRPLRDDKILTSWNALYISALAHAAIAFEEPELYTEAARAADFIFKKMAPESNNGALFRRYRDGEAGVQATLPDYALLGNACLDLYRAGFETRWFARARELAGYIETNFRDPSGSGAFFETEAGAADLIVRTIETYDGVEPSGNAAAARLFLTLALYGERPAENRALCEGVLRFNRTGLSEQGASHSYLGTVLANYLSPPPEIAVVLNAPDLAAAKTGGGEAAAVLGQLAALSGETIVAVQTAETAAADTVPLLAGKSPAAGSEPTVYVCRNLACAAPVHTAAELQKLLAEPSPKRN